MIQKENTKQKMELLKEQNQINEAKFVYPEEMERKLKRILIECKNDDKSNRNENIFAI